MRIGVMQPYFMPYIGYWQVMNSVEKYVIYDDVNFIKGGWINRNRILINGEGKYINVPMIGASPNKRINEVEVSEEKTLRDKLVRKLEMTYQRAPYFNDVMEIMGEIVYCPEKNLALYIKNSLEKVCGYLGISTELMLSSQMEITEGLKAEERLLDICKRMNATEYINAIGGMELYSKERFRDNGIELYFLKTDSITYRQFENEFIPNLSIIDVMMFNGVEEIREMLNKYQLV